MMYSLRKIPKRTDFLVYAGYKFEIIDTEKFENRPTFGFQTRKYGGENVTSSWEHLKRKLKNK